MDGKKVINNVMVKLFNQIMRFEEKKLITDEFHNISINDMHIIESIGLGEGKNMSTIAKELNITVGSLTTSMNSLVKKGYVQRERSEEDRRIVYIKLTINGEAAFHKHVEFHDKMTNAVCEKLTEEEMEVLVGALNKLSAFFEFEYK